MRGRLASLVDQLRQIHILTGRRDGQRAGSLSLLASGGGWAWSTGNGAAAAEGDEEARGERSVAHGIDGQE
jgi:hypothetical protein